MKRTGKFVSLLLAAVMVFAMAVTAYASEPENPPADTTAQKGSITINGKNTSDGKDEITVAGKTFNAYKILDVISYTESVENEDGSITAGTVVYTVPEALKKFYAAYYGIELTTVDFDYQVAKKIKEEPDLFTFAAAALKAAKGDTDTREETTIPGASPKITPVSAKAGENAESVTISDLPLGYYVVEDVGTETPISALILDTTNPDVAVEIKADKPHVDKKIVEDPDPETDEPVYVSYSDASVGDSVDYQVTTSVPDMSGYQKYYFMITDTLSKGLTFNDDVEIRIGEDENCYLTRAYRKTRDDGTAEYYRNYVKNENTGEWHYVDQFSEDELGHLYTVETVENDLGETIIKIIFVNFIQYKYEYNGEIASGFRPGTSITVNYSATVNQDAVIGEKGNPNAVKLTYSNNPNKEDQGQPGNPDEPGGDSPTGDTPESKTWTYVTDLKVLKVDQDKKKLTGAKFRISGKSKNVVIINKEIYEEDEEGTYYRLKDGTYTETVPVTGGSESDNSRLYDDVNVKYSKVTVIDQNTSNENIAAEGYVDGNGVLHFEGLAEGTYTITEIKAPAGYNLLKEPITVIIEFKAPGNPAASTECTWIYTGTDEVDGTNINQITVTNQAGNELPSTGGMGTRVFYVLGFILVAGAAVLLITKRRMSAEK